MAQYVNAVEVKRNVVKLPVELARHPQIDNAKITINEDIITFQLPPAKPEENVMDVWQYVHDKKCWVCVAFTK